MSELQKPVPLEDIALILMLAIDHYTMYGSWPSAQQIQLAMQRPGS